MRFGFRNIDKIESRSWRMHLINIGYWRRKLYIRIVLKNKVIGLIL